MKSSDSPMLRSSGWDSRVEASLLRRQENWRSAPGFRSHGHTLRRLFDDIELDAVLCVEARPTVCIKDARDLADDAVEALRRKLWNLGATTLLVAERETEVQLFSTFTKPARPDEKGVTAPILTDETISCLEGAELALRLQQLVRRVETGAIYRDHPAQFNATHSIDEVLLEALGATRDLICPTPSVDGYRRAHALIGRFLFSCYLIDRGIIGESYLTRNHLPGARDMLGLLGNAGNERVAVLLRLFAALQHDFNGSLFGEEDFATLREADVNILHRFLAGEELRNGQMALGFKLYDFSYVPVELISSIYQEFLGAEAEAEATARVRSRLRNHGQRRYGAYYTPPRLAELAVDIATEKWTTLLDKRCLDPACGSGIFLVILFVRMSEEWRLRNPQADTRRRYDELLRLLADNISGVDVHLTACLVTCFSLYLAFLDQMEPKEIDELRELLNRDARKVLPRILWEREKRPTDVRTIREQDFFALPHRLEYDLVIGNPPWVSRREKESRSAVEWLLSAQKNPAARDLAKADAAQILFPAKELACGFMWKVGLHLKPEGVVCQVLPSRVFLSNNTDRFQAHWLRRHRLETLWLLADYRFILFPGADCPCFIARFHPRAEGEALGDFQFIAPKVDLIDPREALIPVQPEDQKTLSEQEIVAAAEVSDSAFAWKKHYWGTPRDIRLVERLMQLPKLRELCARPPRMARETMKDRNSPNRKGWWSGAGFQPLTDTDQPDPREAEGRDRSWPIWWDERQAFVSAKAENSGVFLENTVAYGKRPKNVRRTLAPELTRPPLLLVNKACTKFLISNSSVIFQDDFQAIAAPKQDENELLFLAAVLGSPLTQYLLFHTTANIGVEREIARLEELLGLPFPLPARTRHEANSRTIVRECAEILRGLRSELGIPKNLLRREELTDEARRKLNHRVYRYFEISEWERKLVEDTVTLFRPSATPSSFDSPKLLTAQCSSLRHREAYAETIVSTFKGWTRTKTILSAAATLAPQAGLAVLTLSTGTRPCDYRESEAEQEVEKLLARIRQAAGGHAGTVFRCLRGFVFYEGQRAHLLKPLNRRHWTHTAALNDADEIIAQMMKEDGWLA